MQSHSVTVWLEQVKKGNDDAASRLWNLFFPELVTLARRRLGGVPRRMEDEEDVALSVFDSFCRAAKKGRFPDLNDRRSLWRLLSCMTHHKVVDLIRRTNAKIGEANIAHLQGSTATSPPGIHLVKDDRPSVELDAMLNEQLEALLDMLPDSRLRLVAVAKMECRTNREIAEQLGCALRTVERLLSYIRSIWREHAP
jgi:DNA-directed RNA polymerase specialized sigma24 family protein